MAPHVVSGCAPNAAHAALASAAAAHDDFRIVTQNVDGLHARAAREPFGPCHSSCTGRCTERAVRAARTAGMTARP
jgi:NAD-dependent SIR2 family protein deacetylase